MSRYFSGTSTPYCRDLHWRDSSKEGHVVCASGREAARRQECGGAATQTQKFRVVLPLFENCLLSKLFKTLDLCDLIVDFQCVEPKPRGTRRTRVLDMDIVTAAILH